MLEQRLKRAVQKAYLDYSRRGKEKCPWKVLSVVNFVELCTLNLVFLNHTLENKGLVYTQYMLAKKEDVRDILDWITRWLPQLVNMLVDPICSKKRQLNTWVLASHCHFSHFANEFIHVLSSVYINNVMQCNWKVQNHTQGPQSKNNYILYTIYPPKKNYFCIITLLNAWGLVTGTSVLPDEKCLSFKTEVYLLLAMFNENCLWSDL